MGAKGTGTRGQQWGWNVEDQAQAFCKLSPREVTFHEDSFCIRPHRGTFCHPSLHVPGGGSKDWMAVGGGRWEGARGWIER